MKRPTVMRLVLAFGLAIGMLAQAKQAPAQLAASPKQQQKAPNEFAQVYQRWQQVQDPEQKIMLAERALALEPALKSWPLAVQRERIKGELQFRLGYAYHT